MKVTTGWLYSLFFLFCIVNQAFAAPEFPTLTGRVVDGADMLSTRTEKHLSHKLEMLERRTSHQVVIVTINSLKGYEIASYGYRLGRHWGIGQKGHDNGLIVLIAKQERKIRIEVGYGLEGLVTDALAHNIIHSVMRPKFKQQQYAEGIMAATDVLINILNKEPIPQSLTKQPSQTASMSGVFNILFFILFFVANILGHILKNTSTRLVTSAGAAGFAFLISSSLWIAIGFGILFFIVLVIATAAGKNNGSGGHFGGGGFGGGFSGGGGSFGGGGASGGW